MSDEAAIRRANLKALCHKRGWSPSELHSRMPWARYTYWRDLLENPAKSFGEKAARRIEEGLELGRGWLDEPDAPVGRYPKVMEPAPTPAPPPAGFKDRRLVSDSDWALLEDVKTAATTEELAAIRARAAVIRHRVNDMIAERIAAAAGAAPATPSKPRKR